MYNLKNHKNSYIVAAIVLIAVVLGGLAYSGRLPGFDFSKLTGSMGGGGGGGGGGSGGSSTSAVTVKPGILVINPNGFSGKFLTSSANQQLVASYNFTAFNEDIKVTKLTIINDNGDSSTDFNSSVPTNAVSRVILQYPNANNVIQTTAAPFVNGAATFLNPPGFYVKKDISSTLNIYAVTTAVTGSISGSKIHIGIKEIGNTTATFGAVGASTNTAINPTFSGGVENFIVRKSYPIFSYADIPPLLKTGENIFYALNVKANSSGPVSFGRIIFQLSPSGFTASGDDIHTFRLYRGGTMIPTSDVNIYCTDMTNDANSVNLQSATAGSALASCDGITGNGIVQQSYNIIVSFNREEIIPKGESKTYDLKGTVSGILSTGDCVNAGLTYRISGTQNPVTGLTVNNGNANTGKISDASGANKALITSGTNVFSNKAGSHRNMIWSDNSASSHAYPTISNGAILNGSGSSDWTNEHLLNLVSGTNSLCK